MSTIPILIVEDQTILREGLAAVLGLEKDIDVVGTAENGLMGFELVGQLNPRIVLMDVEMPVLNGMESLKRIKAAYPDVRVIIFTTFAYEEYVVDALIHGASGFLLKDMPHKKLVESLREADKGDMLLPTSIAAKLAIRLKRQKLPYENVDLSSREIEIAELVMKGLTNREIADQVHLSEGTVKNYLSIIYSKIGTNDRGKAIIYLKNLLSTPD